MAKEAWTVFYEIEDAGAQLPVNFKEKDIKVEGKEKCSGLENAQQETILNAAGEEVLKVNSRIFEVSGKPLATNVPLHARFVTLEGETAPEVAKALRKYVGQGTVVTKFLACKTGSLEEVSAQP
jgi:hypothetical protein